MSDSTSFFRRLSRTFWLAVLVVCLPMGLLSCGTGGSGGGSGGSGLPAIVVNSLDDIAAPPAGTTTLRSALAAAESGQTITFDQALNGGKILLDIVGEEHTIMTGEVMDFVGGISVLLGYFDRDYGASALFAAKNVVIDASNLANGITLEWDGAVAARVLAVAGNLELINVDITGGRSVTEDISATIPNPYNDQPWTLGRGGGLAVWGVATLTDCAIYGNYAEGDFGSSRDRGAYGGGVYADTVIMENCVVSGNRVYGGGAAGGGVFSVGGRDTGVTASVISQSSITENRISGLFAYGGGIYSDGGGIGMATRIEVVNSTVARNLVNADIPPFIPLTVGYWRGGGLYMSNGHMLVQSSTIVENQVHGKPRITDLDKPNMAGGIAATIGNAHAVEDMIIGHSIVAGNTVHDVDGSDPTYEQDIFTGSVFYFRSMGHNRIGVIDFSQILVPVGEQDWASLSRKHYPQVGDQHGIIASNVLGNVTLSSFIESEGVELAAMAVLHYEPMGSALNQVPGAVYSVPEITGDLDGSGNNPGFFPLILDRIESEYGPLSFASDFRTDFEDNFLRVDNDPDTVGDQFYTYPDGFTLIWDLEDALWFGPAETWPREDYNQPYIQFWHRLDKALAAEHPGLGPAFINDDVWLTLFSLGGNFYPGYGVTLNLYQTNTSVTPLSIDQLGATRPLNALADIGAIEIP